MKHKSISKEKNQTTDKLYNFYSCGIYWCRHNVTNCWITIRKFQGFKVKTFETK